MGIEPMTSTLLGWRSAAKLWDHLDKPPKSFQCCIFGRFQVCLLFFCHFNCYLMILFIVIIIENSIFFFFFCLNLTSRFPSQLFCKNSYFLNKIFYPFPNFLLPFFFCFCFKLPPISIPKKSHRKVFHHSIKTFFIPKPFHTFLPCFNLPSSNPVNGFNQISNPCQFLRNIILHLPSKIA